MKFHGYIGYVDSVDKGSGIFVNEPKEIERSGDVTTFTRRWVDSDQNGDIQYNNTIVSVVLPPEMRAIMPNIRYVKWKGVAWQVQTITEEPPRIKLTLGGRYNGYTA